MYRRSLRRKPAGFTGRIFRKVSETYLHTQVDSFRYAPPALPHGNYLLQTSLGANFSLNNTQLPAGGSHRDKP